MVSDMNNLYVISKQNPIQLFDEVGSIENGYDLTGIDDSLPLELDDADGEKRIEHRYHKRFQLNKDAFALTRSISAGPLELQGKSMGCIACAVFNAKPAKLGIIENISMGGLMFQHVDSKIKLPKALVLDILLADCGFYLANMPYKTITDVVISEDVPDDSIEMRQVRLQFQKLSAYQQARLKDFILNHGEEIGEITVKI
jgi:hypothetical protein